MPHIVTTDLSCFGQRELVIARDLLDTYLEEGCAILGPGVTLNFNTHSGCVFLCDEDYRVAMVDDEGNLREWFSCPQCGVEGFDGNNYDQDGVEIKPQFEQHAGYCSQACAKEGG